MYADANLYAMGTHRIQDLLRTRFEPEAAEEWARHACVRVGRGRAQQWRLHGGQGLDAKEALPWTLEVVC